MFASRRTALESAATQGRKFLPAPHKPHTALTLPNHLRQCIEGVVNVRLIITDAQRQAHRAWYYLSTVMDDYSRYILAWRLCTTMSTEDVKATVNEAIARSGVDHAYVRHRPRLLSDNGPCYISGELKRYLADQGFRHTRGKPYHPMTQGKIERYHRSMKSILLLDHYYSPDDLQAQIAAFVEHYNNRRYHESLDNVTPSDMYHGRAAQIIARRKRIKRETIKKRRTAYWKAVAMAECVT